MKSGFSFSNQPYTLYYIFGDKGYQALQDWYKEKTNESAFNLTLYLRQYHVREPPYLGCLRFRINTSGTVSEVYETPASQYAKTGNCFEHRANAEKVAENQKLLASLVRWIDEHGAGAIDGGNYHLIFQEDGQIRICAYYSAPLYLGAIAIQLGWTDQFIRSNEPELKRYFANEEILRKTLYE